MGKKLVPKKYTQYLVGSPSFPAFECTDGTARQETGPTKSFGFRDDLRKATPLIHWAETRVFARQAAGWKAFSYPWDDAQTTATANHGGAVVPLSWTEETGAPVATGYLVPNGNQCIECHSSHDVAANTDTTTPIGPKARYLNRAFQYATGDDNQLAHWTALGLLSGAPADPAQAPKLAVWNDPSSGSVEQRARAYLEAALAAAGRRRAAGHAHARGAARADACSAANG